MIRSTMRFYYLRDQWGELVRVDPLTGLCNYWMPWSHLWMRQLTYHTVSEGASPLVPCFDVLPAECFLGEE
jgi:hypothetical protein